MLNLRKWTYIGRFVKVPYQGHYRRPARDEARNYNYVQIVRRMSYPDALAIVSRGVGEAAT